MRYDDLLERERQLRDAAAALERCAADLSEALHPRVVETVYVTISADASKFREAVERAGALKVGSHRAARALVEAP